MLCCVCKSLLCPAYSEQISQFLLPAMAYGKYPFPFVDLIQALISHTAGEGGSGKNMKPHRDDVRVHIDWSQWLLGAFLNLGDKHIGKCRFPCEHKFRFNGLFIENPFETVSLENSEEHGWKFSALLLNSGF